MERVDSTRYPVEDGGQREERGVEKLRGTVEPAGLAGVVEAGGSVRVADEAGFEEVAGPVVVGVGAVVAVDEADGEDDGVAGLVAMVGVGPTGGVGALRAAGLAARATPMATAQVVAAARVATAKVRWRRRLRWRSAIAAKGVGRMWARPASARAARVSAKVSRGRPCREARLDPDSAAGSRAVRAASPSSDSLAKPRASLRRDRCPGSDSKSGQASNATPFGA
ncbi:hypothetical protein ACFQ9X_53095 [Catenulispora yoronensis]